MKKFKKTVEEIENMIKTWFTSSNTRIQDAAKRSKKRQDKKDAVIQKAKKARIMEL